MKYPRPWRGNTEFEVKKPDTETILSLADKSGNGRQYSAMLSLLEGSVVDGKDLRFMPLINAEFVVREAFRLYDLETKVEGVYQCPSCRHQNIHREGGDEDNRDDVANLEVYYSEDEKPYELNLSSGREVEIKAIIGGEKRTVAVLNKYVLRDPTLDDLLKIEADKTLDTSTRRLNKLFRMCLIEIDGIVEGADLDLKTIQNRYQNMILNFPDFRDFQKLSTITRTYGLEHFIAIDCENCGKKFESAIDFTGFFVSALTSQSATRPERSVGSSRNGGSTP